MLVPNIPITAHGADVFIPFYREVIDNYTSRFKELNVTLAEYGI